MALLAILALPACKKDDPLLKPIGRANLRITPLPPVPASEWPEEVRATYRLAPDTRFMLAFGEVARLGLPAPLPQAPGKAATAVFANGRWSVELGDATLGTLPEVPDFQDFFELLVSQAKTILAARPASARLAPDSGRFLMPGLLADIESAEKSFDGSPAYAEAARAYARLAFQAVDPLDLAPLIPARALALLAAARATDPKAGGADEVLLAHALGYTGHAEALASSLPASSPLRAFESADGGRLRELASGADASEEARYLAVRRSSASGNFRRWQDARGRFLPGNDSVAVIATGFDLDLPHQTEVYETRLRLSEALPRAAEREIARLPSGPVSAPADSPAGVVVRPLDASIKAAAAAADGPLWNADALTSYYEAALYAAMSSEDAASWPSMPTGDTWMRLIELSRTDQLPPPPPKGDTRGAPILIRTRHGWGWVPPKGTPLNGDIRAAVPWLDSRPYFREQLADMARYRLIDPRLAEDLNRSLVRTLGDGSRKMKARAALYLGDWDTVRRLLESPDITAPESEDILWTWYGHKRELERLAAEYDSLMDRFPHDWDPVNYDVSLLRDLKQYPKSCVVVERWLARNPNPTTPGRYHAQIRLAHNYVLAGQPQKGLALLDNMTDPSEFGNGNRERGRAECLAAMGRLPEAEKAARTAVRMLSRQAEARQHLAAILWQSGKDAEAADLLAASKTMLDHELCEALRDYFAEAFKGASMERIGRALDAIRKQPKLLAKADCVGTGLANAGRYQEAFEATMRLTPPQPDRIEPLLTMYGYVKQGKGPKAAAAWLANIIPPERRNRLSIHAIYNGNPEILWDVIGTPDLADQPEKVWHFRAIAFALAGKESEAHREELEAHFGKAGDDPNAVMGRYLIGLAPQEEIFALAQKWSMRSELAYVVGARAQYEGRYRDASDWYRVAAETNDGSASAALATSALGELGAVRGGAWKLDGGSAESEGR